MEIRDWTHFIMLYILRYSRGMVTLIMWKQMKTIPRKCTFLSPNLFIIFSLVSESLFRVMQQKSQYFKLCHVNHSLSNRFFILMTIFKKFYLFTTGNLRVLNDWRLILSTTLIKVYKFWIFAIFWNTGHPNFNGF